MKVQILSLLAIICLFASCSKKDATTPDCETNKYGVIKVSFRAINVERSILITGNSIIKRKPVVAGATSDTLRIPPGSYSINVSKNNDFNGIQQDFNNTNVNQCEQTNLEVTVF